MSTMLARREEPLRTAKHRNPSTNHHETPRFNQQSQVSKTHPLGGILYGWFGVSALAIGALKRGRNAQIRVP